MEPDGTFKTCAELNEYVTSSNPDRPNDGKLVYYPLQESMEILAKKSNLVVFGIFECCRAVLIPKQRQQYQRHVPNWWNSMDEMPAAGTWIFLHACQPGEELKDVEEEENKVKKTPEQMDQEAESNHKRLSWGVVAYLRHKYKKRAQQNQETAYCDLLDLLNFPGVQPSHNTQYEQERNNNIGTTFKPEDI